MNRLTYFWKLFYLLQRRLKGNNSKLEKTEVVKMVNRQQKHQHDLLIAELKKKQGFDEKMTAGDFHIKVRV